jgi:RimJ/RimL family protein N-acetyltransferase
MAAPTLTTRRLVLRHWRDGDLGPFRALNGDTRVMQYFPSVLTTEQSDNLASRIRKALAERDYGFWAAEAPSVSAFIGFVGLGRPGFESHFTPCVEIGWRLAEPYWGRGYASEAASAVLRHAFATLELQEVVSFTLPANRRSVAVMERIGMTRSEADDFDRPDLPEGHPMRRHVLYRVRKSDWVTKQAHSSRSSSPAKGARRH